MNSLPAPTPIQETHWQPEAGWDTELLHSDTPRVIRGVAKNWGLVVKSGQPEHALAYLRQMATPHKTTAFIAEPEHGGRLFYNDAMTGFNFTQVTTTLGAVVDKLSGLLREEGPPTLYMGSTNIEQAIPGFTAANDASLPVEQPLVSLWLGNRSRIAAHFDYPRNLAVCVLGRRRFTVFPPEQVGNLYVGPWDITPAGQPISLVDTTAPDLEAFPRYAEAIKHAQVAELEPGDALYLPGMWWHGVESLSPVNGLVNYWWSETDPVYGAPMEAFNHALLSLKQLPVAQRRAWQALFNEYVFEPSTDHLAHIPGPAQGKLAPLSGDAAKRLRAELINRLKR